MAIDSLIANLISEISMDGSIGTEPSQLIHLIQNYYYQHSQGREQNVDQSLVDFVWGLLVGHEEVVLGVMDTAPPPPAEGEGGDGEAEGDGDDEAPSESPKKKKQPSIFRPLTVPELEAFRSRPLPDSDEQVNNNSVSAYLEYFGQGLRLSVTPTVAWVSITGSHARTPSLTPKVYEVLQMISRRKGTGMSVIEIGRITGIDPKSVFHLIKTMVNLGIVVKVPTTYSGLRTNQIIHKRYLSTSPLYLASSSSLHLTSPTSSDEEPEPAEEEESDQAARFARKWDAISSIHLFSNERLVKERILRVLRAWDYGEGSEREEAVLRSDLKIAINLISTAKREIRKLYLIINQMAEEGKVEKVQVDMGRAVRNLNNVMVIGVKLPDREEEEVEQDNEKGKSEGDAEEEEEEVNMSRALGHISIDRQIIDLLAEAGPNGLRNFDLSVLLSHFPIRTIDQTLLRLSRHPLPNYLADQTIQALHESHGREQRTRWFIRSGYLARMEMEGGAPEPALDVDEDKVGGWGELETGDAWWDNESEREKKEVEHLKGLSGGSKVPRKLKAVKRTTKEKREWRKSTKEIDRPAKKAAGTGVVKKRPPKPKTELDEDEEEPESPPPKKERIKPLGRAPMSLEDLMRPGPNGKLTYYQRMKLEALERERLGLPPKEKRDPKLGGRRPKGWVKGSESEAGTSAPESSALAPPNADAGPTTASTRSRPRKNPSTTTSATLSTTDPSPLPSSTSTPVASPSVEVEEVVEQPVKKRDRPRKSLATTNAPITDEANPPLATPAASSSAQAKEESEEVIVEPVKKRGRPRKNPLSDATPSVSDPLPSARLTPVASTSVPVPDREEEDDEIIVEPVKKRGRPRKSDATPSMSDPLAPAAPEITSSARAEKEEEEVVIVEPVKKRGRPRKNPLPTEEVPNATPSTSDPPLPATAPRSSRSNPLSSSSTIINTSTPKKKAAFEIEIVVPRKFASPVKVKEPPKTTEPDKLESTPEIVVEPPKRGRGRPKKDQGKKVEEVGKGKEREKESTAVNEEEPSTTTKDDAGKEKELETGSERAAEVTAMEVDSPVEPSEPSHAGTVEPQVGVASQGNDKKRSGDHLVQDSPVPSKKGNKKSYGPVKVSNLAVVIRQKNTLDYIEASGGIIDYEARTNILILKWLQQTKPDKDHFLMDNATLLATLKILVEKDALKKTVTNSAVKRHDIYYLPRIALDSPEMTALLEKVSQDTRVKIWHNNNAPLARVAHPSSTVPGVELNPANMEMPSLDDRDAVRDFFHGHVQVRGAQFGCYYGRFARAQALHEEIVAFQVDRQVDNFNVVSKDDVFTVITNHVLPDKLHFGVLLRILPISVASDELTAFVAEPSNHDLMFIELPRWVRKLILPTKKKQMLRMLLTCLADLRLLDPLVHAPKQHGTDAPPEFEAPKLLSSATHWRIHHVAPLYAFAATKQPLVAVLPITSVEQAQHYWAELKSVSLATKGSKKLAVQPVDSPDFPPTWKGVKVLPKALCSTTKWRAQYMLLYPQRQYVTAKTDASDWGGATEDEREALVAELADVTFAPVDIIKQYVEQVDKRPTSASQGNKKRRVEESPDGDADEDEGPVAERTQEQIGATLRFKAADVYKQRVRLFKALTDRFIKDHGGVELDEGALDFLRERFSRSGDQINASGLHGELSALLPPGSGGPASSSSRSIVPVGVTRQGTIASENPYALPRTMKQPVTKRQPRPSTTPRVVPPMLQAPVVPVVVTGQQDDFLSRPARAIPVLKKGERLPRNFFSDEQNELIMDAAAICKARAKLLKTRVNFTPLEAVFPGLPSSKLRAHFLRMVERKEEEFYHERLIDAWIELYLEKRETPEVPDPHPTSLTSFDIAAYLRCLRANVDKGTLRLAGPPVQKRSPAFQLPATLAELREFNGDAKLTINDFTDLDSYWRFAATNAAKEQIAWHHPFGQIFFAPPDSARPAEALAMGALKMCLSMPEAKYEEQLGHDVMQPFEAQLDSVIKVFSEQGIVIKSNREVTRRGPGRNFSLSDRYLSWFEDTAVTTRKLTQAKRVLNSFALTSNVVWPLVAEDGDMMSFIHAFSEGTIILTPDASLSAELRPSDDYQTRKADDETIETVVSVRAVAPSLAPSTNVLPPSSFLPASTTCDENTLEETLAKLDDESATRLYRKISDAGENGITLESLKLATDSNFSESGVASLTDASPPLVFWAGEVTPTLISCLFLPKWTLSLKKKIIENGNHSDTPVEPQSQLVFPAFWIDLRGEIVVPLWEKAKCWITGILLHSAGSTAQQIYRRGTANALLTLSEVMQALIVLEEQGVVARRQGGEQVEKEEWRNWDEARWFPGQWIA